MHTNSNEKVFYMKNHLLEKLHPQKPNRKKVTGLLRSGGKKIHQISVFFGIFVKSGQTMVKLLIQEVLVLLNNYSRILVLLNNYFSYFNFGQIWSNCGQTMVKLIIQEILVLLNNYCFLKQ